MQPELSVALERALVHALLSEWHNANACFFRCALRPPTLELSRNESTLGRWHPQSRTLEISRPLVLSQPWRVVVEVLKHEMAHQYAHEVLGARDETSHGQAFQQVCARMGIDARAAGVPSAVGTEESDRIVERIAKLLALAESDNQHEAEAAMAAAQKLMLKHNLESIARIGTKLGYEVRALGEPTGRTPEHVRALAMILGTYFFVEVIWVSAYRPLDGTHGSVLEVCGTRENVAMAEYVHAFLLRTAEELWAAHKRATAERSNRDRRTFLSGVMSGFADKLKEQTRANVQAGLVWVGDAELHAFHRRRHPYVRSVSYGGARRTDAFEQGREHGRNIVLNKPVDSGSESRGRALPPKR